MIRLPRLMCLVAACAVITSCVRNAPYRFHYPDGTPASANVRYPTDAVNPDKILEKPRYRLGFVEFDDRGEMFDRRQLAEALGAVRLAKQEAHDRNKVPLIAVFIHGWHHNASQKDDNVEGFRKILDTLARELDVPVTGIYIGWRGEVVNFPVLRYLTFWDRRNKSQNLPNAHLIETLLSIAHEAKGLGYTDKAFCFFVGHSFGGALLEAALTQTFEETILHTPVGKRVDWPIDLTVFLNSASPAVLSYQLIESMNRHLDSASECKAGAPAQPLNVTRKYPVIISMTSAGDSATHAFFVVGQTLSRPANSLRQYGPGNTLGEKSQVPLYKETTANTKDFQSHLFVPAAQAAAGSTGCRTLMSLRLPDAVEKGVKIQYTLAAAAGARNRTAYWVFQLPPTVVPDHTDIFQDGVIEFFRDLILLYYSEGATMTNPAALAPARSTPPIWIRKE